MIPIHFSHWFSHLGPDPPSPPILAHSALYITVLCHAFQLQFLKNPPVDIAKTYQNQFVTLTDGGPT